MLSISNRKKKTNKKKKKTEGKGKGKGKEEEEVEERLVVLVVEAKNKITQHFNQSSSYLEPLPFGLLAKGTVASNLPFFSYIHRIVLDK